MQRVRTRRQRDWLARLQRTMRDWDGRPVVWGSSDCACFAGACVAAVTGTDPLAWWRGYSSERQAHKLLRARGYRDLADATGSALDVYGWVEVPPPVAGVGAIGITQDGVLCVRSVLGFLARDEGGRFYVASPVIRAWDVEA